MIQLSRINNIAATGYLGHRAARRSSYGKIIVICHKKARHRRAFVINYQFSIINFYSTVTDFAKFRG